MEWIDVRLSLPQHGERVLVTRRSGEVDIWTFNSSERGISAFKSSVSAWVEMPEPYSIDARTIMRCLKDFGKTPKKSKRTELFEAMSYYADRHQDRIDDLLEIFKVRSVATVSDLDGRNEHHVFVSNGASFQTMSL